MTVRVVTDSTSGLDRGTAEALGITMAQSVHFGTRVFEDGVTITPDEFYEMLSSSAELSRQASAGEGQDLPEGPFQPEGGRTGVRADRVPGGFVQHHPGGCP